MPKALGAINWCFQSNAHGEDLETSLVRKLQTFFHLRRHCSIWQWSLSDVAIHTGTAWSLSMAWSPIPLVVVPLVMVPLVWCLVIASLLMVVCRWRPFPTKMWANIHEGSNPWSATLGAGGSCIDFVAPYP